MTGKRLPGTPRLLFEPPADEVIAAIIDRAVPADSGHCVFAEHIQQSLPWATRVSVDLQTIRLSDPRKDVRYTYLTPRKIQEALVDWDRGITPDRDRFSFRLQGGQTTRRDRRQRRPSEDPRGGTERIRRETTERTSTRLVPGANSHVVPGIAGGDPPPLGHLAGGNGSGVPRNRRRAFGVRALDR